MDGYAITLAISLVWHGLAVYHFIFFPARTIARYTAERPVNRIAEELLRFLGGINIAIVGLCALALAGLAPRHASLFAFLAVANLSQFVFDLVVHRTGLVDRRFLRDITIGDGLVAALNAGATIAAL